MDNLVALLASAGVRMTAVIDTPPAWAAGSGTDLSAAHYGDYAAFAAAFAARYGVGGSFWATHPALPYLPITDFEIWDEANSTNFWSHTVDAAAYAAALIPTAQAIHAADPSADVLASIGWQSFQTYLTALYADGVRGTINGIAFHPYAPDEYGITLLAQQLRALLIQLGDPALPIEITEIGQPVVASGTGATHAYDGEVTDAARAATLSLAGDALARSDCGVTSYLLYGLLGSGTQLEPGDEGFMGIFSVAGDTPDLTGQAIIAASARWRTTPTGGIVLCGSGTTPTASLLPLTITSLTRPGPACAAATIDYYGNPIEDAKLVLRTADGRVAPAATNAFGQTQMCLQNGPAIKSFTLDAEIANVAVSATYTCPLSSAPCVISGVSGPAHAGGVVRYRLRASLLSRSGSAARLSARLLRSSGRSPVTSLAVWLWRHGHRARGFVQRVNLHPGHATKFTVSRSLHRGDRLVSQFPPTPPPRFPHSQQRSQFTDPMRLAALTLALLATLASTSLGDVSVSGTLQTPSVVSAGTQSILYYLQLHAGRHRAALRDPHDAGLLRDRRRPAGGPVRRRPRRRRTSGPRHARPDRPGAERDRRLLLARQRLPRLRHGSRERRRLPAGERQHGPRGALLHGPPRPVGRRRLPPALHDRALPRRLLPLLEPARRSRDRDPRVRPRHRRPVRRRAHRRPHPPHDLPPRPPEQPLCGGLALRRRRRARLGSPAPRALRPRRSSSSSRAAAGACIRWRRCTRTQPAASPRSPGDQPPPAPTSCGRATPTSPGGLVADGTSCPLRFRVR